MGRARIEAGAGAAAERALSLETPIGDEEDSHLGDFIEDKNAILPLDDDPGRICERLRPACSLPSHRARSAFCACASASA